MKSPLATAPKKPSSSDLLARILETPDLAAQVQALPPPVLARLIDHVGLEDAGELVAFATTEQIAQVFDEDLWRSTRAGEDERFDADRFLVWLEVMLEAGDTFVAEKLAELPFDLVTLAFHKQILVVDLESLMGEIADEDEWVQTEKALASCLSEELEDFHVISRRHEGWDNVLAALLALDRDHHPYLTQILESCRAMSAEYLDDNGGLYEVLTSEEMLEGDVAAEREDRRAEAGHVAPSMAASFLKLARGTVRIGAQERDPITRAYFRGLAKQPATPRASSVPAPKRRDLQRLLSEAGVVEAETTNPLQLPPPTGGANGRGADEPLVSAAMRGLAEEDPARFFTRSEELAYLANALAAGCGLEGRRLRPAQAVRMAIATCSLGIELALSSDARPRGEHGREREALVVLRTHPADILFRAAWGRLHADVVLPAARITEVLFRAGEARAAEPKRLRRAAARLRAATADGTPWKALPELEEAWACVDPASAEALRALMDECPTLRGPLGEAGGSEARLVSSKEVLARVQAFLRRTEDRACDRDA